MGIIPKNETLAHQRLQRFLLIQSFTFEELSNLIEKFSSSLNSLGIKEKDVVTLYASNSYNEQLQ